VLAVQLGALLFNCGLTAQPKATPRPNFADYAVREMLPDTAARAPLQPRTSFERAFHLNSRLLVVRCSGRWDKTRNTAIVDTHYMVWTGSRFDPLVRIEDDRAGRP
jgi:hypothetical protein